MAKILRAAVIAVVLFWAGFYGFFAYHNHPAWESLKRGMSEEQLTAIMGKPRAVVSIPEWVEWQYSKVSLRFVDGKLDALKGDKGDGLHD